jgi:hypothetical protein
VNLYQKINEIKKEVGRVAKDVTVGSGRNSYKATSHDAVLQAVNTLMINHNVISWVEDVDHTMTREAYDAVDYNTKAMIKKYRSITSVKVRQCFCNADDPKECLYVTSVGHGDDPSDKGAGKAYSYAVKYAYLKLFGLATGENDEARHDYSQTPAKTTKPNSQIADSIKALQAVKGADGLKKTWLSLPATMQNVESVVKAKDAMKAKLGL